MGPALSLEIHDVGPARPLRRSASSFPDPNEADANGAVAMRGGLAPETIVEACRQGIVPSPHPDEHGLWFSPDPRAIIVPCNLHVSRRLDRTIRSCELYVSLDAAFERVLGACAERGDGKWITAEYRRAYLRLHELGWAHSFEVWTVSGELAGGLYGLNVGGLFGVESIFYAVPDASKIAMVAMAQHVQNIGVTLIDVRTMTPHLGNMGAVAIPRSEYLEWVRAVSSRQVAFAGGPCDPGQVPLENNVSFNTLF